MRGLVLLTFFVILIAAPCGAADTWTDVMPGVRHLHRVTAAPWNIHVLVIDLTNPHVKLRVGIKNDNYRSDDGETVRSQCLRYNAVAGINCDFWGGSPVSHCPQGHTMTDGLAFPIIVPDRTTLQVKNTWPYVFIDKVYAWPGAWFNAAGGGPRIIRNGVVGWEQETDIPDQVSRQPRTGAAITADRNTLILATVDGRQPGSIGMTANELGALLQEFGGYNGMAFDSGGSTTMVVHGATVNYSSDGSDRPVADCLMILDNLAQPPSPLVHYESDFDSPLYAAGPLAGVDGWTGSGVIVSAGRDGGLCARFSSASATRIVSAAPLRGVQWVECCLKASSTGSGACFYTAAAGAGEVASAVRLAPGGSIEALDGDGAGGGAWKTLSAYSADTWYRVHVRLDYNINSYQVFVNGALKLSGAFFRDSSAAAGLRAVGFEETGGASQLSVDDIYAGSVDPNFLRVSPDTAMIVRGGRKRFTGVSGSGAVVWSVVDEKGPGGDPVPAGTVARIDSTGILTALAPGSCVLRAWDTMGRSDASGLITVAPGRSISGAKALADGQPANLAGVVVTGVFDGFFYAQQPDRLSAVKIMSPKAVSVGDEIWVIGTMGAVAGERVIYPTWLEVSP